MLRAIKVRLYPNKIQAQRIKQNIGNCRFLYNHMLSLRKKLWENSKKNIHKYELMALITELKKEYEWLKDSDATSLQQAISDMDKAYQNFFRHGYGFPKFKKRQEGYGSFRCSMSLRVNEGKLKIGKHNDLKFRCSKRDHEILSSTRIRNATISMNAGLYYASCLIELPDLEPTTFKFSSCGIDLGIKIPVALAYRTNRKSTAYKRIGKNYTQSLINKEKRRKRYQRRMARKEVGSNNFKKAKNKVQRAFKQERDYRANFVEQVSCRLARNFAVIAFENLNLKGMTKAVKKNEEGIRKGRAAKSRLNRSLLRNGMYHLVLRTEQKSTALGGLTVKVNPAYTSQTCSQCGHVDKNSRKSQARFVCTACGYQKNADLNAARNVLKRAA